MATLTSLMVSLRANTGQFDKAMDGAERRTRSFGKTVGSISSLKHAFGGRSDLKDIIEIGRGTGPIVALTALAGAFQSAASDAAKMREQLLTGEITLSQYKSRLVELIPVMGSFAKTGREIGESIREAMKSVNEWNVNRNIGEQGKSGTGMLSAGQKVMEDNRAARLAAMDERNRAITEERERHRKNIEAIGAELPSLARKSFEAQKNLAEARSQFGPDSEQFANASAAARAAMSNRNNLEGIAARLKKTENETYAENLRRINMRPSPFLPFINGVGESSKDILGGLKELTNGFSAINRVLQAGADRRSRFISGAADIYERLKEQQNGQVQFAGAIGQGSQQDIAMRQQAIFGNQIAKKTDEQLMKEAVDEQKKANETLDRIRDGIGQIVDDRGITFN